MVQIPNQLQEEGIRFVLLEKQGKKPFEKEWQKKAICFGEQCLIDHINRGGNYGVLGGGDKNLLIVDFDNEQIQEDALKKLPETFTVKTGRGLLHLYYFSNGKNSFKIFDEELNTLADVQGEGKQVVGAGSLHPNGNYYEVIRDMSIQFIDYSELRAILLPYDKKPKKEQKKVEEKKSMDIDDTFLEDLKSRVKVPNVLSLLGIDTKKNPTECPMHQSNGGKCFGFNDETWHCFHCEESGNIFTLVTKAKNIGFKEALEFLALHFGMEQELKESRKKYWDKIKSQESYKTFQILQEFLSLAYGKDKKWSLATELLVNYIKDKLKIYTTKNDQKSEVWIYKEGIYISQGKSEIKEILRNVLNEYYNNFIFTQILSKIEADTLISPNEFFSVSYKNEICVNNGILNIMTLELSPFTPEKIFFSKCPVNYKPECYCDKIEQFLQEVLSNKEDIKLLYELAGFSLLKEYRFEKAFMFVGNGRNGKGKTIEILKRLVGMDNCCSVPLAALIPESFSISELFGKMLNLAGDIGNNDLKETSMFKSLTGRDLVNGKRKFLNDLHFENYAKFVFACNDLPMVYDMSRGFWDRWILMDFPYTFVTQEEYDLATDKAMLKLRDEDIISKITTSEEMSGFLNMALVGLRRLIIEKKFSTTMGSEEVKSTWIKRSNSFMAFCIEYLEEDYNSKISKKDLRKRYAKFCKQHKINGKSDIVIKRVLQENYGANEIRTDNLGDSWDWYWEGVKWKN